MAIMSGFFSHQPLVQEKPKARHFINVGGELFHAVAVSLIDYLKNHGIMEDDAVKRVLKAYNDYFPNSVSGGSLRTPKERMMDLLHGPRQTELVERMAYVLRQITVDTFYEHPTHLAYRAVFMPLEPQTPGDYLRAAVPIDTKAVRVALTEALELPIVLSYKTREKILRKKVGSDKDAFSLLIQVQGDQYYPGVHNNKHHFNSVGKLAITVNPVARKQEGTISELLHLIETDNKRLLSSFEHEQRILMSMVDSEEVDLKQLTDVYIALLHSKAEEASFVIELQQKKHPVVAEAPVKEIILLVDALASSVAVGAVSQDNLYERLDTAPKAAAGH